MHSTRTFAVAALVSASLVTSYAFQSSQANRPWPPGVQTVPDTSPALSPADALKTFYMAPGYHLELVAAEPLVQDPILINWDPDGRLWVVEMPGFVPTLDAQEPNMDPIGRIVVLEDTNNDGRMDKRTVFADGLVLAKSLNVLDHGVLVGEPPYVWLMHDTNGDLKMDTKEMVTDMYGRREARVEQNANGLFWAMDNWMHTAVSDVILRLKNGKFDVQKTLARGEWSATQDDAGRIYRNTNSEALHVDFVPTPYYARHPGLLRTRGSYDGLDDEESNVVWPVRPNPGTNRSYQFGILRADNGSLAAFTSICAPMIYRGDRLPDELRGNVFAAEPAANVVSRFLLKDDGTTLRLSKAYERAEFLASTDERFRPVFLSDAPDGTLYIVDMYRGIIQQRADVTEYLRDQIITRKLDTPTGLGRIYRVMHETTKRDSARPELSKASPAKLVETLSSPNGWRRDTAQRLLVERGDPAAVPALKKEAAGAKDWRTRAHALWTLDGIDAITPAIVVQALADSSRDVRVSAVRLSERWLSMPDSAVPAALLKLIGDGDWNVQMQVAASVGALPAGARELAIAMVLDRHGDNPIVMDAALSGSRGVEAAILDRVLQSATQTPQRDAAITMLAGTIVRGALDANIQNLFQLITDDARASWQRSALLRGAEVALLGSTMPGTPARARGAGPAQGAPCPTCPGGRAGPGGAYAFPQVPARGGGAARRTVRLNREPTAMSALAAAGAELSPRVTAVMARVEWPGKPGAVVIPALSPEEERRFNAGAEVYKNICINCHQPDGRGQEKVAANLVGSALALASPDVPARILLNGKEGPIGLMPPVGSTLSDDQIAAVLTYIRREWGQAGNAVDPAVVRDTRALTAGRVRPWTNDELLAIVGPGRGGGR